MQCSEIQNSEEATADLIVCVASSVSWHTFITPAILVISVLVAIYGVSTARATARKKATLDLIETVESSAHYRQLHAVFSRYRQEKTWSKLNNPKTKKAKEDRKAVQDFLNHYELVSVGILSGILDLYFYRDWMLGPFVRDWNAATSYIQRERWKWNLKTEEWDYREEPYENFQKVAKEMSHGAIDLVKDDNHPGNPTKGAGDEILPAA